MKQKDCKDIWHDEWLNRVAIFRSYFNGGMCLDPVTQQEALA